MKTSKTNEYQLSELYTLWLAIGSESKVQGEEIVICKKLDNETYQDVLTDQIYPYNNFKSSQKGRPVVFNALPILQRIKNPKMKDLVLRLEKIDKDIAKILYYHINDIKIERFTPDTCTILSDKKITNDPSKFRESELESLLISIALNKKPILLTGTSGIGKTSLVEKLIYLKNQNKLPEFLKNTEILELNLASLDSPKKELTNILSYIKENKAILYISGINDLDLSNDSILSLLINEATRQQAKIIISTNDPSYKNYQNIFEIIELKELTEEQIKEIATNKFKELEEDSNISIKNIEPNIQEIVSIIYECTQDNQSINFNNNITNPGFVTSIIEKSFALAKSKNAKQLELEHIIKTIKSEQRINPNKKTKATEFLQSLKPKDEKPKLFFKK